MNSDHHRRVEAVFSGMEPDRVPICEQAFASSVASDILGRRVHTGSTELHYEEALAWLGGDAAHENFVETVYRDMLDLHRDLDLDILFLPWRNASRPTRRVDKYRILYGDPDGGDWQIFALDPTSRTYGLAERARPPDTVEDVKRAVRSVVDAEPPRKGSVPPLVLRAVHEVGNEFVVAGGGGMAIPMNAAWLELTVLDRGLVCAYLDRIVETQLLGLEAQAEAGIRLINGGGDFAFNSGPVYSPEFFDTVMAPRWKKLFDRCRELGLWYVMRSDGNLWPVADVLFGEARPHAYYECDYDAGMHFDRLRERFHELVLMGNVSCSLLLSGTEQEVRERMTECIDAAWPRVVAGSANSILHGTPAVNVLAMFEAAAEYGGAAPRLD